MRFLLSLFLFGSAVSFAISDETNYQVLGIGTTCTDFIIHVDDAFLERHAGGEKGGAYLIPLDIFDAILSANPGKMQILPGGSAANTIRGLGHLGQSCVFFSYAGNDIYAKHFIESLRNSGVTGHISIETDYTGPRVLCMITPDGDRTMRILVQPHPDWRFEPENFHNVRLVYIEGYGIALRSLEKGMELAKAANSTIALGLASFEIVSQNKDHLLYLLSNYVDIVFGNENEIEALTGLSPEEGCLKLQELCPLVVVTLGDQGCLVGHEGEVKAFPAFSVNVLDSTGAGDLFASGFLHGYLENLPLSLCAKIGNLLGSSIVTVEGAELPEEKWEKIHAFLKKEIINCTN